MELKERILALLTYTNLTASAFAKKIGVKTNQSVYDLTSGKTRTLSQSIINKITSCYPEISLEWLMTGEGEMLRPNLTQNVKNSKNFSQSGDVHVFEESATSVINKAMDEIAAHRRMLEEELKKKIDPEHIETQIKDLNDRVNSLIEQVQALNDYLHQKYN